MSFKQRQEDNDMSEEKLAAAAKLLANQIARGGAVREDACLEVLRTVIDLARDPAEGWECYEKKDGDA